LRRGHGLNQSMNFKKPAAAAKIANTAAITPVTT
jgi:hypothetical protein